LQALRSHHPGKPSGFKVKRIVGNGDLWITEYTITYQGRLSYTVSIMEFLLQKGAPIYIASAIRKESRLSPADRYREVLVLNRKREEARRAQSVACVRAFDSTT
jgi:hypothetical protein